MTALFFIFGIGIVCLGIYSATKGLGWACAMYVVAGLSLIGAGVNNLVFRHKVIHRGEEVTGLVVGCKEYRGQHNFYTSVNCTIGDNEINVKISGRWLRKYAIDTDIRLYRYKYNFYFDTGNRLIRATNMHLNA